MCQHADQQLTNVYGLPKINGTIYDTVLKMISSKFDLLRHNANAQENEAFSDVEIVVENGRHKLRAHKLVLASSSGFLRNLFLKEKGTTTLV